MIFLNGSKATSSINSVGWDQELKVNLTLLLSEGKEDSVLKISASN